MKNIKIQITEEDIQNPLNEKIEKYGEVLVDLLAAAYEEGYMQSICDQQNESEQDPLEKFIVAVDDRVTQHDQFASQFLGELKAMVAELLTIMQEVKQVLHVQHDGKVV